MFKDQKVDNSLMKIKNIIDKKNSLNADDDIIELSNKNSQSSNKNEE